MKRLAFAVIRLYCAECDHIIWWWQDRCGSRHSTCIHAAILTSWRFNRDATGGPDSPWPCAFCHRIPAP